GAKVNGVCPATKKPFAPRAQEIALTIKNNHGMLATCDQVDIVLRIDIDARHFHIPPSLWELAPALAGFIPIPTVAHPYTCHAAASSACRSLQKSVPTGCSRSKRLV